MAWHILPAEKFSEYSDKWDSLNEQTANSPVLNSAFVIHSLASFATGNEKLAVYEDDGHTVAITILYNKKFGVWDTWQPSQSPIGLWITKVPSRTEELLKALAKELPGIVLQIGICQLDPSIYPRVDECKRIKILDYIQTASIPADTTYDQYWAARGKNLRHNLKRQRNRLKKDDIATELRTITQPNDIRKAITEYGDLENAGWKSTEGTAVHIDNEQGKFYMGLLTDFCKVGKGAIYQYLYNGKIVATDLCIQQGGTFVILKTTYDETIKTSSPAFLMRQEAFQQLFPDPDINNIEFYGKVMDWHTKWSDNIRTLYHLNYRKF